MGVEAEDDVVRTAEDSPWPPDWWDDCDFDMEVEAEEDIDCEEEVRGGGGKSLILVDREADAAAEEKGLAVTLVASLLWP